MSPGDISSYTAVHLSAFGARAPGPLCQVRPVLAVSALLGFLIGGDSNNACFPTATSVSTHLLYSSEGRNQTAAVKANKPLFRCQRSDNDLSRRLGWRMSHLNRRGKLIKGARPLGRRPSVVGHSLTPSTRLFYNQGLTTNRSNTPPQS